MYFNILQEGRQLNLSQTICDIEKVVYRTAAYNNYLIHCANFYEALPECLKTVSVLSTTQEAQSHTTDLGDLQNGNFLRVSFIERVS